MHNDPLLGLVRTRREGEQGLGVRVVHDEPGKLSHSTFFILLANETMVETDGRHSVSLELLVSR